MSNNQKPEKPKKPVKPVDGGSSYVTLNDPLKNKVTRNKD